MICKGHTRIGQYHRQLYTLCALSYGTRYHCNQVLSLRYIFSMLSMSTDEFGLRECKGVAEE